MRRNCKTEQNTKFVWQKKKYVWFKIVRSPVYNKKIKSWQGRHRKELDLLNFYSSIHFKYPASWILEIQVVRIWSGAKHLNFYI